MGLKAIAKRALISLFPPTGNLNMAGYQFTNLGTPTVASNAATKEYVDTFVSGLNPLVACRVATTANLTGTYSNGTAGVGATLTNSGAQAALSIDGTALSLNDRVLVKDQSTGAQNGIYIVSVVGSGAANWVLTRSTDFDTAAEMIEASSVNITAGATNIGATYVFTTSQPITVGTTALTFVLFSVAVNSIIGTAKQVIASAPSGVVTLNLPQDIDTDSDVEFNSISLTDGIVGVTTGDPVPEGYVGEEIGTIIDLVDAVSLSDSVVTPVASLAIPAGRWTINASLVFSTTAITASELQAFLSSASGSSTDGQVTDNTAYATPGLAISSYKTSAVINGFMINTPSPITIYLKGKASLSAGSVSGFGFLKAVRG